MPAEEHLSVASCVNRAATRRKHTLLTALSEKTSVPQPIHPIAALEDPQCDGQPT